MSIAVSTPVLGWAGTRLTCHIEEHILGWLVQTDHVNLDILGVTNCPTAARGGPERLVERGEVGSVEGRITATLQTGRESEAGPGEAQQDVVTDDHENFHSQLYFITVSGLSLAPS